MAHFEATAVGGYYPLPQELIPHIAKVIDTQIANSPYPSIKQKPYFGSYNIFDPAAGKGEALVSLAKALFPQSSQIVTEAPAVRLYGCELEGERAKELSSILQVNSPLNSAIHADAFTLNWEGQYGTQPLMQLTLLNPPYDTDRVYGRLEHRFLTRITKSLQRDAGIIIYVVPHYALSVSAEFLAGHYTNISCFRFPDHLFPAYKQVVLIAKRRQQVQQHINQDVTLKILQWAEDATSIPKIDAQTSPCIVLPQNSVGKVNLSTQAVDEEHLKRIYTPFYQGTTGKQKPMSGMGMQPLKDIIGTIYPVVMPPKPAHIALALASGLFNGYKVYPDEATSSLPAIVVKGIYAKEAKLTETKTDKDGNITKKHYVEQPKLEVVALNLSTHIYHTMRAGIVPSGAKRLSQFNIADLLHHYGKNLTYIMQEKCPALHNPADPAHSFVLPKFGFKPYPAQAHIIMANLKMLFTNKEPFTDNGYVLGEVGTGKTFMALAIAAALSSTNMPYIRKQLNELGVCGSNIATIQNVLVVCPPHLVQGWQEQATKILPAAQVKILKRIPDIMEAAKLMNKPSLHFNGQPGDGLNLFILSREMGKLGHAWESSLDSNNCCPECGKYVRAIKHKSVKERHKCPVTKFIAINAFAEQAEALAYTLGPALPDKQLITSIVNGRIFHSYLATLFKRYMSLKVRDSNKTRELRLAASQMMWQQKGANPQSRLSKTAVGKLGDWLMAELIMLCQNQDSLYQAESFIETYLLPFLMIFNHPERDSYISLLVKKTFSVVKDDKDDYSPSASVRQAMAAATLLMTIDSDSQQEMVCWVKDRLQSYSTKTKLDNTLTKILHEKETGEEWSTPSYRPTYHISYENSRLTYCTGYGEPAYELGTPRAAYQFLEQLLEFAEFAEGKPCQAPLYTAVPKPRRFPLATLIAKKYPQLVDFLIIDEAHENANGDSAQAQAAHRLEQLGVPTLHLTGTNSNGYASSLFANMHASSKLFRQAFERDQLNLFVDRYGYRKLAEDVEYDATAVKVGVQSDRVQSKTSQYLRKIGQAPGILPKFIFDFLLPIATAIQKEDLNADLPPLEEIAVPISLEGADAQIMLKQYEDLRRSLVDTILSLRGTKLSSKLWGAFAQLPSYFDRAHEDTGNEDTEDGRRRFSIRYPHSEGGALIKAAAPFEISTLMPKEEWLIDKVQTELSQNNYSLVFVWNTGSGLARRVYRFLHNAIGEEVALLNPKVKATDRQEWIQKHVIDKRKTVLICNPKAVETGLNNLTWFNRAVWFQNPNANAILYRQGNGRIHRIGQKSDSVKVYVPYYENTAQETMFQLLALKIQAAVQIDGVDIESALVTAGASLDDASGLDGMSIGKALYQMMQDDNAAKEIVHFSQDLHIQALFQPTEPQIVEPIFAF